MGRTITVYEIAEHHPAPAELPSHALEFIGALRLVSSTNNHFEPGRCLLLWTTAEQDRLRFCWENSPDGGNVLSISGTTDDSNFRQLARQLVAIHYRLKEGKEVAEVIGG